MDFRFTDEQIMFRDAIRAFLKGECTPAVIRASWADTGSRSVALAAGLADLGLTRLTLPEDVGGLGLAELDAVIAAEECGHGGVPLPVLESAAVASSLLAETGSPLVRTWLEKVGEGKATVTINHEVNGFVADGADADLFIVKRDDALYALPRAEVEVLPIASIDLSKRPGRLTATPSAQFKIASGNDAHVLWDKAFDRAALYAAADLLGAAQRILNMAVEYANQRQQFGKPIGSFQAVKHLLADVQVKLTFARPVVYHAAYLAAKNSAQTPLRISHAKIAAGDAAALAVRRAFQVHGAIGYTWEYDLQIWMKRVWSTVAIWGTAAWHRERLARTVLVPDADLGAGRIWAA